jgi:hypothetical protein
MSVFVKVPNLSTEIHGLHVKCGESMSKRLKIHDPLTNSHEKDII